VLPRGLSWRLVPTYLILIAAFTAVVLGSFSRSLRGTLVEDAQANAVAHAQLLGARIAAGGLPEGLPADDLGAYFGLQAGTRLTVATPDGLVLADSWESAATMANHADRPEIRAALAGGRGTSIRYSETVGSDLVYGAVTGALPDGRSIVVRTATSVQAVEEALASLSRRVALAAGLVALVAALLAWFVSWRISRQLEFMGRAAERFAAGDFAQSLPRAGFEELDALGDALGKMGRQLDERLHTITTQSHERQAVLSSLSEAVLAVDREGVVLSLNDAAVALLGAEGRRLESQPLQAVLRDARIESLVGRVLETGETGEVETVLRDGSERILQVRGSVLRESGSGAIGVVLVLADVSRLRRLESVRQEFVANVSHELRTPVTSVKGFVETLRDGALDDRERAEHFLGIVARQADRLHAIIEDLLTLSRLESEEGGIETSPSRLRSPLAAASEACAMKAKERNVSLEIDCPADLRGEVNAALLEQAVVNLVDNAVKFSEDGGVVRVTASRQDDAVVVSVQDEGPGIPREHHARLFERFYRVDRARSRAEGGTGLGLAIVKHIAQAHGGSVAVESRVGEGATFRIQLPL
jgi:two-component system phosphate regulon sensor histidine kinase PhoR